LPNEVTVIFATQHFVRFAPTRNGNPLSKGSPVSPSQLKEFKALPGE
jgi:hypothetical protein